MKPDCHAVGGRSPSRRLPLLVAILGGLLGSSLWGATRAPDADSQSPRPPSRPNLDHDLALALLDDYVPTRVAPTCARFHPPPTHGVVAPAWRCHRCDTRPTSPPRDSTAWLPRPSQSNSLGGALYRRGLTRLQMGGTAAAIEDLTAAEAWFRQHAPEYVAATTHLLQRTLEQEEPRASAPSWPSRAPIDLDWSALTTDEAYMAVRFTTDRRRAGRDD